ncbi:UvrD-helicase domain-containing protein [Burkholderia sp. A1]|uniref:UvrD-helicase domain-containing protein n=1 Tax=Burkholderia sp. A1 TaxID=148446 RepID=UPI000AD225F2|nr:UvrD-helicase domain-containing protein [Burkholderia sp. A1]
MSKYIVITESALDQCLLNGGLSDDFLPQENGAVRALRLTDEITGFRTASEPDNPYVAIIKKSCLDELKAIGSTPADAFRRIARVVKGLKSPPIHLPRQWSEYHYKNLLAFFALPKGFSTKRWVVDMLGEVNTVRFDALASSSAEVDLTRYIPSPWPDDVESLLANLASSAFETSKGNQLEPLAEEVDLKTIGSASVASNKTYEEWEGQLNSSQGTILGHSINASIRIVGPAGSGKTLALCMRALQIARDAEVRAKGKKVLIITHSWAMSERIDGVLTVLNGGQLPSGVTIFPLLSLLELHAGHIGQHRTDVIGDDSSDGRYKSMEIIKHALGTSERSVTNGISQWITEGLTGDEDSRARLDLILNLYEEISGVLTASGVAPDDPDSIRKYVNSPREDWMPPFSTVTDRGFVISIYREFIQELIDRSSITTDQFVLDSIRVLETFTWRMRKETDGYDFILVDELQLFDPQERAAIELLGRSKKGVPFVTAEDPSQGVFSALNTHAGIAQNEMVYLDTVHRFNKQIFDLISFMYQKFPLNTLPLKIDKSKEDGHQRPRLFTFSSDEAAVERAVEIATQINRSLTPSDRICFATLGDVDRQLAQLLEREKLPVTRLTSFDDIEQLAYSKRSIVVAPWQFIGGTQFTHVIVVAAGIVRPSSQFGKLRELISVYLACSRAVQSLDIVCSAYTPAVVSEAKDQDLLLLEY